ncbi:hypothetical protein TNCV_2595141 [Trichonephila clavipes]|nr:hypothetical protein TNCV_2595141 [Trichonephila clavipes]
MYLQLCLTKTTFPSNPLQKPCGARLSSTQLLQRSLLDVLLSRRSGRAALCIMGGGQTVMLMVESVAVEPCVRTLMQVKMYCFERLTHINQSPCVGILGKFGELGALQMSSSSLDRDLKLCSLSPRVASTTLIANK